MDNFTWKNIYIETEKAGKLKNVSNWKMINVEVHAKDNIIHLENSENIMIPKGLIANKKKSKETFTQN